MPFDFNAVSAPFRMQPGLRKMAAGPQPLTPNRLGERALVEKLMVLNQHRAQALLAAPGFDAQPALHALCAHAQREHPAEFGWDGVDAAAAMALGWAVRGDQIEGHGPAEIGACLAALPTEWRLAGLLCLAFAEDFAVIESERATIPWLAVCLPSHWAPETKVGRHFAEVHAAVADNQLLLTAAEHLARLVTGTERWERFVWTITRQPALQAHPQRSQAPPWQTERGARALASQAHFRTEHQTFIPLPSLRQAVFTIHVEVQPLVHALAGAERARRVHDALASMSPAVLAYRGLTPARDGLLEWLHAQAKR